MGSSVHKKCRLGNITLLSTHNSGCYNAQNTIGVKCQDRNIAEQLQGGVRVFDIRVRYQNGWAVMHHAENCPPIGDEVARQQYDHALYVMRDFLLAHPSEILLIRLQGSEINLTVEQRRYVLWKPGDVFRSLLFDEQFSADVTYGRLLDSGKRVLILVKDDLKQADGWWPSWALFDNNVNATWEETQSKWGPSEPEKLELVRTKTSREVDLRGGVLDATLIKSRIGWPVVTGVKPLSQCDFNVWTPNIGYFAEYHVNPMAARMVREWGADPVRRWGANIVNVDYFNLPGTGLMDAVIEANVQKMKQIVLQGLF
jgi:hypothetical protein